jgi:NADH-quinone oxidoreductase subunit J
MDMAVLCYAGPVVAAVGLLLCFPDRPPLSRWLGAGLAAIGVAAATYGLIVAFGMPLLPFMVLPAGIVAVWLGGRMIAHANPVYSALYFGGVVICAAVLVLAPGAHFLAAILVIVYAGAILVAYVFVIMLAQQDEPVGYNVEVRQPVIALAAGLGLIVAVVWALMHSQWGVSRRLIVAVPTHMYPTTAGAAGNTVATESNVVSIGSVLFGRYPVSIEVAGVFLLIAMIGAIVLASMRTNRQQQ